MKSLAATITRDEAIRTFKARGMLSRLAAATRGPLQSTALVAVPLAVFRVKCGANHESESFYAIDLVRGGLDPIELPGFPGLPLCDHDQAVLPCNISEAEARQRLIDRLRRLAYRRGFFRIREMSFHAQPAGRVAMPYYIGLFGYGERASLQVTNAVTGQREGMRAVALITEWLRAGEGLPTVPGEPLTSG
jgi:hypothetical protein